MSGAQPEQARSAAITAAQRPPWSVLLCDGACVAFAAWTVLCHAVVLLSGTPVQLGWAVLSCALIATAALAYAWRSGKLASLRSALFVLAGDRAIEGATDTNGARETSVRTRAIFFVAGCAIAARFYVKGDLRELWMLALAYFVASLVAIANAPRPLSPPGPSRAREAVLWLTGGACAAFTLGLHAPDTDDSFYGNVAVSVVDFPQTPLLAFDTLHGIAGAPLKMVAYKAASIELLSGFISKLTGIETLQVYHLIVPAIAALFVPLALARLFRPLAGERWLWAVLATVIVLAFDVGGGRGSFSAFAFPRLFQGKAMFVSIFGPLLIAHGLRFGLAPSAGRFALLAAAQIAAVGVSVTAFWAGPVLAMLGVLAGLGQARSAWKPALAAVAASGYVLALGLFIVLMNRSGAAGPSVGAGDVAPSGDPDLMPGAYAMVLGQGPHLAASIAVALIAWPLCQSALARRFAVLAPLLFFAGAGNPLLTRYVVAATTSAIFWRVLWLLPIPMLAGLAASSLIGRGRTPLALARVPLVGLALALFVGFTTPDKVLSRNTLEWPRPKVDPDALRVARAVVKAFPAQPRRRARRDLARAADAQRLQLPARDQDEVPAARHRPRPPGARTRDAAARTQKAERRRSTLARRAPRALRGRRSSRGRS